MLGRNPRLQSAMEYLMTYGWSILIIAVVLGALFGLGVFNGTAGLGSGCVAQSGFLCSQGVLSTNGLLTIDLGQTSQQRITVTDVGCSATTAEPTFSAITPINLSAGQTFQGLGITCPVTSDTLGSSFTGTIWIEYTTTQYSGVKIPVEIGTISAKEQIVGAGGGGGGGGMGRSSSSSASSSVTSTTTVVQEEANISLQMPPLSGGAYFVACAGATYDNIGEMMGYPSVNFTFGGQNTGTTFVGQLGTGTLCTAQINGNIQSNSAEIPVIAGIELPDDPTINSDVAGTNVGHISGETDSTNMLNLNYTIPANGTYVVGVFAASNPLDLGHIQNYSVSAQSFVAGCFQVGEAVQEAGVFGGVEDAGNYMANITGSGPTLTNASIAIWAFTDANAILNAPAPVTVANNATWWYC